MKKLGRKIKLNFFHFSQDESKSVFGDKKMDLDPSPMQVYTAILLECQELQKLAIHKEFPIFYGVNSLQSFKHDFGKNRSSN